jgi:hypothetical protein
MRIAGRLAFGIVLWQTIVMDFGVDKVMHVVTRLLPAAGIDAIMIGGHAVNHYGVSRATQDIDFMVAAADTDAVRWIMHAEGFTNVAEHETVIFFHQPGAALRVDFLKVDRETLDRLLAHAKTVEYFGGHGVRVPQLRDLLAMKLFSLSSGKVKREDKDFPDIVNLVIENQVSVDCELRALCRQFADDTLYARLCARIKELQDD